MGIPRFFKWLAERYPCVITPCNTPTMPSIDNLYLDMNGIIHVCTHSNDKKVSQQESEKYQMQKIFSYIDKMFHMVKPTQYFYMAIDGVAPRAKMNQQRQRRFRSAFEAEKAKQALIAKGESVPEETFNSNCITPGTPFMEKLSRHLQYFIAHKIETDVKWRQCKIIYSGHDVPGEGEHKIMDFIRKRKMAPNYNPNEKHVLYGLDADLIMLGLVTHEPHFMLLREDVFEQFNFRRGEEQNKPLQKNFQLLHLSILREYFNLEFRKLWNEQGEHKFDQYDLERIIDDFVFICFFCGNDFLPHSPTLDIGEGAIGVLFEIYQQTLLEVGYLTERTQIKFKNVNVFCSKIAAREETILLERYQNLKRDKRRFGAANFKSSISRMEQFMPSQNKTRSVQRAEVRTSTTQYNVTDNIFADMTDELNLEEEIVKQDKLLSKDHIEPVTSLSMSAEASQEEELIDVIDHEDFITEEEAEEAHKRDEDLFKNVPKGSGFNFEGWRGAYYKDKLNIDYSDKDAMKKLISSYIEGLKWNYHYYYNGCASWGWFFPYSYSPLMTDIADADMEKIANEVQFDLGTPFFPFQQLLGVLPPSSAELLPEVYRPLMTSAQSPIADMFPESFKIDREGTRYEYEGVVILPFMDEKRLLAAEQTLDLNKLTQAQKNQNILGVPKQYSFDEESRLTVQSLISDMPSVTDAKIRVEDYKDPTNDYFVPHLCDGVKMGRHGPEGFPSLTTIPVTAQVRNVGTTILGHPSKKPSLCVIMKNTVTEKFQTAEDALYLLGKQVYIGYPMPQPAIISSVADIDKSYYGNGSNKEHHSEFEQEQFQKEAHHHQSLLFGRFALDISEVKVLVYCRLFKGMMKDTSGSTIRKFSKRNREYAYPAQLILHKYHPIPDPRFKQRKFHLQDEFKAGDEVICLDKEHYGCIASVTQTVLPYSLDLAVTVPPQEKINFPKEMLEATGLHYFSIQQMCKYLTLPDGRNPSPKSIGSLTTGFKVSASGDNNKRYRLGLKFRHTGKGKILLHYARCQLDEQKTEQNYFLNFGAGNQKNQSSKFSTGGIFDWEYSEKAVELLQDYINRFPEVFYGMEASTGRISSTNDLLFGQDVENPDTFMAAVDEWIHGLELDKKMFISATNNYLDKEHLDKVEYALVEYDDKVTDNAHTENIQLTAKEVYKPPDPVYKGMIDANALDIGHRVVHIRKEGQVPFGLKGVVVGIENDNAQVIFDSEFTGGSTFSECLKTNRGQILPKLALLNLSEPRFANPDKFSGSHFSVSKSKTFKEHTPYNSITYYNVARRPPQGVIDISDIKDEKKKKQISKKQKQGQRQSAPKKSVAQIREEAGVPSSAQKRNQYNPDDLLKEASDIVNRYNVAEFTQQSAWFQNLSQFNNSVPSFSAIQKQQESVNTSAGNGQTSQKSAPQRQSPQQSAPQRQSSQKSVPQSAPQTSQPSDQTQVPPASNQGWSPADSFRRDYSSRKKTDSKSRRSNRNKHRKDNGSDSKQHQEKKNHHHNKQRDAKKEHDKNQSATPAATEQQPQNEKAPQTQQKERNDHKKGHDNKKKNNREHKKKDQNGEKKQHHDKEKKRSRRSRKKKSERKAAEKRSKAENAPAPQQQQQNQPSQGQPQQYQMPPPPQTNANGGFYFVGPPPQMMVGGMPVQMLPPGVGYPPPPYMAQFQGFPNAPQQGGNVAPPNQGNNAGPQQQGGGNTPQGNDKNASQSKPTPRRRSRLVPAQAVKSTANNSKQNKKGGQQQKEEKKESGRVANMLSEADILESIQKKESQE